MHCGGQYPGTSSYPDWGSFVAEVLQPAPAVLTASLVLGSYTAWRPTEPIAQQLPWHLNLDSFVAECLPRNLSWTAFLDTLRADFWQVSERKIPSNSVVIAPQKLIVISEPQVCRLQKVWILSQQMRLFIGAVTALSICCSYILQSSLYFLPANSLSILIFCYINNYLC